MKCEVWYPSRYWALCIHLQVCQLGGQINPLILSVESLYPRHSPSPYLQFRVIWKWLYDSWSEYLALYGRFIPEIQCQWLSLCKTRGLFFVLIFIHHFEPLSLHMDGHRRLLHQQIPFTNGLGIVFSLAFFSLAWNSHWFMLFSHN